MDHREVIRELKFQYYATYAAMQRDDEANQTHNARHMVDFYDFLLRNGYNRFQLSALGVSRKNALGSEEE